MRAQVVHAQTQEASVENHLMKQSSSEAGSSSFVLVKSLVTKHVILERDSIFLVPYQSINFGDNLKCKDYITYKWTGWLA